MGVLGLGICLIRALASRHRHVCAVHCPCVPALFWLGFLLGLVFVLQGCESNCLGQSSGAHDLIRCGGLVYVCELISQSCSTSVPSAHAVTCKAARNSLKKSAESLT